MRKIPSILTATALIAALGIGLPGGLAAKERRGADLAVTAKDGREVRGELMAVKPDSLLLFDHMAGHDASVDLADIAVIRIIKKSKALTGLLVGLVPGAVGGAVLGAHQSRGDMPELGAFFGGLIVGGAAGLVGLVAGFGAGIDSVVRFAGLSEAEKSAFLAKLNRHAREPGIYALRPAGISAAGPTEPVPAPRKRSRIRLSWTPGYTGGFREGHYYVAYAIPFRFTESLPPGEAGPYSSTYYWATHSRQRFSLGRFSLGYQWTPRFGAEIEFSASKYTIEHLAHLEFSSTIDGLTYWTGFLSLEMTHSASVLAGLFLRALAPTDLQPHAVEVALAAGPAWLSTTSPSFFGFSSDPQEVERKMTWTARARISYDYHFGRILSIGVYGEYRWLKADLPAFVMTGSLDFHEVNDYYGDFLWRSTEVTLPAQSLDLGGFACGLRFNFGF